MKSSALVALLQIPESTIRKYARDFEQYLSPGAAGASGRHREYSDHDARVLKLIVDMKRSGTNLESIGASLAMLQANNWEQLPPLETGAKSLILDTVGQIQAQADRSALQREIEVLRTQIDHLEQLRKEDLAAAQRDRDELLRRMHKAETLLELYQQGKLKPGGEQ